MGRRAKKIYYGDQLLYYTDGKTTIRVSEDTTNKLFVLFTNNKRITTRKNKKDIAEEFFKLVDKDKYVDLQSNIRPLATASEQDVLESLESGGEIEITITADGVATAADITKLTAADICKMFATIYRKDPVKAEALSGITHLSTLATMDFNFHSQTSDVTLDDLLNCYIQSVEDDGTIKEKNKKKYISDAKKWWAEFRTIVEKKAGKRIKLLSDINKEHVICYINELCKVASQPAYGSKCIWLSAGQKKKMIPPFPKRTWIRHRKGKLITILAGYISENHLEGSETEYKIINNILNIIRDHKRLKKLASKPKPKPQALS